MSFHVPELARDTTHPQLGSDSSYGNNGMFDLDGVEPGWRLALICSDGNDPDVPEADGWEHVSTHAYRHRGDRQGYQHRTPSWKEMAYVKRLCWDGEDVVVQYHPRESDYVNLHPHVLHLWRYRLQEFPTPPSILVGPKQEAV
jgi:hypothetical protein